MFLTPPRRLVLVAWCLLVAAAPPVGRAAPPEASGRPDLEARVRALVRRLGDDDFRRREAAHQALLGLGADVVPLLDRLGPQDDAEVRARLERIRHDLLGYVDDIRAGLAALPEIEDEVKPPLPDDLKRVILAHQPKSGDFLLSLVADPKDKLHRRTVNAFVLTWDGMTAAQIETYARHILILKAQLRERYPQGVDAAIGMLYYPRYGWGGWPSGDGFRFVTRTRHFLDGKPYGTPFSYQGPMATTGWVRTKDLEPGKHTCSLEVEYEFTQAGVKHTGRLRSPDFAFTMVPADTPDDLVAPPDAATDRLVRESLRFAERESSFNAPPVGLRGLPLGREERRPQITWEGPAGKRCGIATLYWKVATPLPVDLCFEVTLEDQRTGKVYPCDSLVLRRGEARWGYVSPRDAVAFARGRAGEVPVKVVLKASRKTALTSTEVTRYYPGTITSEVLTVKVFDDATEPDRGNQK